MLITEEAKLAKIIKNTIDRCLNIFDANKALALISSMKSITQNELILLMKRHDVFIDRRGVNKYEKIINTLYLNEDFNFIKTHLDEVRLINKLFEESKILQQKLQRIPPKSRLGAFYARATFSIKCINIFNKRPKQLPDEQYLDRVSSTLKSLLYDEEIYKNNCFQYDYRMYLGMQDPCNVSYMNEYYFDSIDTLFFEAEFNDWRLGYKQFYQENDIIKTRIIDKIRLTFLYYSRQKQVLHRMIKEKEYFILNLPKVAKMSILKALREAAKDAFRQEFFSDLRCIIIDGIKINDWILAYYILIEHAQKDIPLWDFHFCPVSYLIDKYRCKTREKWIRLFVKKGLSQDAAEHIFEKFIFNKKSDDIFNCPFIPVKKKFLLMTQITANAAIKECLTSRFSNLDTNIDFKGINFENYVLKVISYMGYPAITMHNKANNEECECDVAFVIDKTICFCECKHHGNYKFSTFDDRIYYEDIVQLNRISSFYLKNKNLIKDNFKKAGYKNISFSKSQNYVIHSRAIDGIIEKDNTIVLDLDKFLIPFNRDIIAERLIEKYPKLYKYFNGDTTIKKMNSYYHLDVYECNYKSKVNIKRIDGHIGSIKIDFERCIVDDNLDGIFDEERYMFKYVIPRYSLIREIEENNKHTYKYY